MGRRDDNIRNLQTIRLDDRCLELFGGLRRGGGASRLELIRQG